MNVRCHGDDPVWLRDVKILTAIEGDDYNEVTP